MPTLTARQREMYEFIKRTHFSQHGRGSADALPTREDSQHQLASDRTAAKSDETQCSMTSTR